MAQSLETRVTDLINEITALKQRYEQYPDVFDERLAQFTASFQSTIQNLDAGTIYVDQINGDDANDGAAGNRPVATLQAAISLIPEYGGGDIHLLSDIDVAQNITVRNRQIRVVGDSFRLAQIGTSKISLAGNSVLNLFRLNVQTGVQGEGDPAPGYSYTFFQVSGPYDAVRIVLNYSTVVLGSYSLIGNGGSRTSRFSELNAAYGGLQVTDSAPGALLVHSDNANWSMNFSLFDLPSDRTWSDLIQVSRGALLSNITV